MINFRPNIKGNLKETLCAMNIAKIAFSFEFKLAFLVNYIYEIWVVA